MIGEIADMNTRIIVGFGDAVIMKDGKVFFDCEKHFDDTYSATMLADAENMALKDPCHKWEAVIYGPLHGVTFERIEPGIWMVTEENKGFA